MHKEQQANVGGILSVQSNDFQSSEITLLTSYDIHMVMKTRKSYQKNSIIGYLHINYSRNKIINLKEISHKVSIDILCIDETQLDESFPDAQFMIENYQFTPLEETETTKGVRKWFLLGRNSLLKD